MSYVHLHTHNHIGSRMDGIGAPEFYAERAVKFNHPAIAITDHGRLNGIYEHQKACLESDIKPIIGIEAYLTDRLVTTKIEKNKEKRIRTKAHHIVLLVKNEIGYKNLLHLNYLSMKDANHFYYVPRIMRKELFKHSEGLVVGTACIANPFIRLLRTGKAKEAVELFKEFLNVFREDFYVEIQLNELTHSMDALREGQKSANNFMIKLANKFGVPIVITGDVHYLEKGQDKLQTLSIAIRDKATIDNLTFELESKELYYQDINDFIDFNERWKYGYDKDNVMSWCNNSVHIADKCNHIIRGRTKLHLPKMTDNDDKVLIEKGKKGLIKRFKVDDYKEIPREYRKRLEMELEVLIRKGFSSYCLICEDIVDFSMRNDIYGRIGRGSCSGSLLLWALNVHNFDPIKFKLLFERFMSQSRSSDLVLSYLEED